jgi:hypothetical protein
MQGTATRVATLSLPKAFPSPQKKYLTGSNFDCLVLSEGPGSARAVAISRDFVQTALFHSTDLWNGTGRGSMTLLPGSDLPGGHA